MPQFIIDNLADHLVTLRMPGKNYRNCFQLPPNAPAPSVGQRITGTILAPAWKVDVVTAGGNYVEPLMGRPRRMQGAVVAIDGPRNQLTVEVGYPVIVQLPPSAKATHFTVGSRIGWDNLEIPVFQPQGG